MPGRARPLHSILSLRGRLLFLISLATLPAVLFTFFAAENERSAALERTERDALHMAGLASREHAHQIRGARRLLTWLGAKLTHEWPESPILTDPEFLQALLAGHPQLANVGVLSPQGQVLASACPLASYGSWTGNPAYRAALSSTGVVAGTYLVSPIFARPTLNHAYAVRDTEDRVVGVLFNGLDLAWLSEMAAQIELPEGSSLLIVDRQGRALASSTTIGDTRPGLEDLRIPDIAALAESGRGRLLETDPTGARSYFVATALEDAPGLFAAIDLPYDRVVGPANSAFYWTLGALGLLTSFVIASVFLAAEIAILRGLRSLSRAAQRFGAGELSARAPTPSTQSELASLATAFNTMADALEARHAEAVEAQARLRALAGRLHVARESEAARISRDLHDEVGQVLTSLKIDLSRLPSCCAARDPALPCAELLRADVATISQQIDGAIGFLRRISSELRPGVLDKLGLTATLEWLAREIEARTGLAVQVEADVGDEEFGERLSVTLFRIAQEALNNVVRHARASMVEIHLAATETDVFLTVRDDGIGISPTAEQSGRSLGILGMRERAALLHGRLSLHGAPGRGTSVDVTIPKPARSETPDADPAR